MWNERRARVVVVVRVRVCGRQAGRWWIAPLHRRMVDALCEWARAHLLNVEHVEGASTSRLGDDRQVLRVDCTEGRVPAALSDAEVLVALLPARRLPVDVLELALAHKGHRRLRTTDL